MATELGSDGEFWSAPKANHANSLIAFARPIDHGLILYMRSFDGTEKRIEEESYLPRKEHFQLLEWAPDDSNFAYAHETKSHNGTMTIVLWDPKSGRRMNLPTHRGLQEFVWLSPTKIAYINTIGNLHVLERKQNTWADIKRFDLGKHPKKHLMANSVDSVIWQQDNSVWTLNLSETALPFKLWTTTNAGSDSRLLIDYSYSPQSEKFLLNCGSDDFAAGQLFTFARYQGAGKYAHLTNHEDMITNVMWINWDQGCAWLAAAPGAEEFNPLKPYRNYTLFVKNGINAEPLQILGSRETLEYTVSGDRLYILGSKSHEPASIWEYNTHSGDLTCVVSGVPKLKCSKLVTPTNSEITNKMGTPITYRLWPPTKVSKGRKYPVIVTQTPYRWFAEPQAAANCGYYFAAALRSEWRYRLDYWTVDVTAICAELIKNPNIDTNRMYLFGSSAEAAYASNLLEAQSGLWRGAFFESPAGLPEPTITGLSELMLIGAADQQNAIEELSDYQARAARMGLPVHIAFRTGPHAARQLSTKQIYAERLAEFLKRQ
jgi:predicted esterase